MTEDLVDGHRLKPDASQLQVCIITILLTTFICITKKCQMQYLLLCNQQQSEVLFPLTADTKLLFKRTSVCEHPVHLYLYLSWCHALTAVCMRNNFCTSSMTLSTSYALVKRKKLLNPNKLYSNLRINAYLHRTFHQTSLQTVKVRCHTKSQILLLTYKDP